MHRCQHSFKKIYRLDILNIGVLPKTCLFFYLLFPLIFSLSNILSCWYFVTNTFCVFTFHHVDIWPCWHFVVLTFCHVCSLSLWHFVIMTFCHYDILSLWHFVIMTFCHYDILSCWHYCCIKIVSFQNFVQSYSQIDFRKSWQNATSTFCCVRL